MAEFIKELRERRVLPALGVYAASCWVVVEILDRMVDRHQLSPYLTDIVFWGLYSLIPAVLLIAWSYGRPGKDTATTAQKIGVPINVLATAGMLFIVFGGKDLGATAEVVGFVDEEGVQTEVLVPKEGFRQRVAIFFYDNESSDPELDWIQYAATDLLSQDLGQDPYMVVATPYNGWGGGYFGRLKAAGFEDGLDVPVSLLREIARDANRQYFTEGSIRQEGDEIILQTRIWDAQSMTRLHEITRRGWDLYALLDETSLAVREALEVPSLGLASQEDLPLAETYGESREALQRYIQALNTRLLDNDVAGSLALLDETLASDRNFVMAHLVKASFLAQMGNLPAAVAPLEEVQRLDFRLPSRDRANAKTLLYRATGQNDRLIEFLRLQARLLDDAQTHVQLAQVLMVAGESAEARTHFERALELDPLNRGLNLVLSDLARSTGSMDDAIRFVRAYQAAEPLDVAASLKLGDLLRDSGELEAAKEQYRQAALMDSSAVDALLRLQLIAARQGDIASAEQYLEEAFRTAQTAAQKSSVHLAAYHHEFRLGRIDGAVAQLRAAEPLIAESQPPFVTALSVHTSLGGVHLRRSDVAAARAVLEEARALVPEPPLNQFLEAIMVSIAAEEGDFELARQSLANFDAVLDLLNFDGLGFQVPLLSAAVHYSEGNYAAAAEDYRQAIEQIDSSFIAGDINAYGIGLLLAGMAEAEVRAGQLETAQQTLKRGFGLDPASPNLWSAQAMLHQARGQLSEARAAAANALASWVDADPELIDRKILLEAVPGAGES